MTTTVFLDGGAAYYSMDETIRDWVDNLEDLKRDALTEAKFPLYGHNPDEFTDSYYNSLDYQRLG